MLMIDMRNSTARLSLPEITAAGRRYVSNPAAFAAFMAGLRLGPEILAEPEWRFAAGAAARFTFFRTLMHAGVPRFYDLRHLEGLGGRFALRLAGAGRHGEFTVVAVNRRVLTLSGLPRDDATGRPVIDAEIRADAFLALWNDLLAELAQTTLERIAASRTALRPAA
ncbi:hypothetical protein [Methylobacterium sp. ARG-1]|uniref:hypothetical protein n=1 Tax=Methylobacterium sp. ARG-1 TaxID=1692501 RepID=UPI0006830C60|nr:hypothetical protein [Methylobacterium sp. ARG-1]KNY20755.1 hypothetical protein AKJ13_20895 [Methylobacterium sp. ARG-1]